jgi:8-oxo-dGTP diphosphatase
MTVVSMTRKTHTNKNVSPQFRFMKNSTTALHISVLCNIVLSSIVAILLFQQFSTVTVHDNKEQNSKLGSTTRLRALNNRTSVGELSNLRPENIIHRDYVFHGGHPVTSELRGSCYCSGVDMYCMCNPSLAIDIVIISGNDHLWFVRRKDTNQLAIVGGFVDIGETVLDAVHRELYEETGLIVNDKNMTSRGSTGTTGSLSQQESYHYTEPVFFGIYSDPRRDNRRHTVSAAFAIHFDGNEQPIASDDVKKVERIHISHVNQLTLFADQKTIVQDYLRLYYDTKTKTSADFLTSYDDFAPDIHRSICIPFHST